MKFSGAVWMEQSRQHCVHKKVSIFNLIFGKGTPNHTKNLFWRGGTYCIAPLQCDVDSWDYKTPDAAEEAAVVFACRWCIHPQASLKLRPWSCPRSVWAPWWTLGTTTLGTLSLSDTVGLIETKECAARSRVFFSRLKLHTWPEVNTSTFTGLLYYILFYRRIWVWYSPYWSSGTAPSRRRGAVPEDQYGECRTKILL